MNLTRTLRATALTLGLTACTTEQVALDPVQADGRAIRLMTSEANKVQLDSSTPTHALTQYQRACAREATLDSIVARRPTFTKEVQRLRRKDAEIMREITFAFPTYNHCPGLDIAPVVYPTDTTNYNKP
jgi:hypothetical protein